MAKVIGLGETIFDIIFSQDNQPVSGRPGGSVFNAMISLGRKHIPSTFISEIGNDRIGHIIKDFLIENNVDASNVTCFEDAKSPLALAFLDENKNAQYTFYKDYPSQRLAFSLPEFSSDDILLVGSYFALNPVLRPQVKAVLERASQRKALIYYDVNFRATHRNEVDALMPTIIENYKFADIVKGSDEDFENMYGEKDIDKIYHEKIRPYCRIFICTCGKKGAYMYYNEEKVFVESADIEPVSTVGAGDSFNAGTIYGLISRGITHENIHDRIFLLPEAMKDGRAFATEVCLSYENYVQ